MVELVIPQIYSLRLLFNGKVYTGSRLGPARLPGDRISSVVGKLGRVGLVQLLQTPSNTDLRGNRLDGAPEILLDPGFEALAQIRNNPPKKNYVRQ